MSNISLHWEFFFFCILWHLSWSLSLLSSEKAPSCSVFSKKTGKTVHIFALLSLSFQLFSMCLCADIFCRNGISMPSPQYCKQRKVQKARSSKKRFSPCFMLSSYRISQCQSYVLVKCTRDHIGHTSFFSPNDAFVDLSVSAAALH